MEIPFAIVKKLYHNNNARLLKTVLYGANWLQYQLNDTINSWNSHEFYINLQINHHTINDQSEIASSYFYQYSIINPTFSVKNGKFIELLPHINNEIKIDYSFNSEVNSFSINNTCDVSTYPVMNSTNSPFSMNTSISWAHITHIPNDTASWLYFTQYSMQHLNFFQDSQVIELIGTSYDNSSVLIPALTLNHGYDYVLEIEFCYTIQVDPAFELGYQVTQSGCILEKVILHARYPTPVASFIQDTTMMLSNAMIENNDQLLDISNFFILSNFMLLDNDISSNVADYVYNFSDYYNWQFICQYFDNNGDSIRTVECGDTRIDNGYFVEFETSETRSKESKISVYAMLFDDSLSATDLLDSGALNNGTNIVVSNTILIEIIESTQFAVKLGQSLFLHVV